jgi:DNA-3-methyladenine glycosylase
MGRNRRVLPRRFYDRDTLTVAADLIGKVLVHRSASGVTAGAIVETEAYIGESDPACHAAPGPTKRNAPLYGPPGVAYVYLNYGMHYLVNAVTEGEGSPAAVLIRALDPLEGVEAMQKRRGGRKTTLEVSSLCRGPGNLTKALGISLVQNGVRLTEPPLSIEDWGMEAGNVVWGPRIGIRVGTDRPWRCYVAGHACVSGKRT